MCEHQRLPHPRHRVNGVISHVVTLGEDSGEKYRRGFIESGLYECTTPSLPCEQRRSQRDSTYMIQCPADLLAPDSSIVDSLVRLTVKAVIRQATGAPHDAPEAYVLLLKGGVHVSHIPLLPASVFGEVGSPPLTLWPRRVFVCVQKVCNLIFMCNCS